MLSQNIYLVGPMGAGKTTIGRLLANELKRPFLDTDHEVEARSGVDLAWIFDVEGEDGFRLRESRVIADLCTRQGVVMATGGGAVQWQENRKQLSMHGFVVYLYASVAVQLVRTINDKKRPQLQQVDRPAQLTALSIKREPLYREIADLVLDTGQLTSRTVIAEIIQAWQGMPN